jgi:voltage-gated sodium channel
MSSSVAPEPTPDAANGNYPIVATVPGAGPGLFSFKDPQSIKDSVKEALKKQEPYNVSIYYKEGGIFVKIATHPIFENCTLAVIAINAVYIAIDTDWNKDEPLTPTNTNSLQDSDTFFQFMEHAFCTYFTFEWIVRFLSFKIKTNGLKDGWFVFDSALVFMMVMETWVLLIAMSASGSSGGSPLGGTSILRLFRLLRLSRLMRMLRSLPELMILIKGMVTAMKSVMYVMGLLVLITYVFAIAFTQLAVGHELAPTYFANVSHAMYSLLIYATFLDDLSAFTEAQRCEPDGPLWYLLIVTIIFIALSSLTVMNMLIGVLCEVVSAVAEQERDDIRTEQLAESMKEIVMDVKNDASGEDLGISYKEFCEILKKPEGIEALDEVGVNPVGIVDFAGLFFFDGDKAYAILKGGEAKKVKVIHFYKNDQQVSILDPKENPVDDNRWDAMSVEDGDGKTKTLIKEQVERITHEVTLEFEEFMEIILEMRESNGATVKDMLNLWKKIKASTNKEIAEVNKMVGDVRKKADSRLESLAAQNERMEMQLTAAIQSLRSVTDRLPN